MHAFLRVSNVIIAAALVASCDTSKPPPVFTSKEAHDSRLGVLRAAKGFRCDIGLGSVGDWMVAAPPRVKLDDERGKPYAIFSVTDIDAGRAEAKLLGNGSIPSQMKVIETSMGIHFLTVGLDGSVSLLSVFADSAAGLGYQDFAAAWSEHTTLILAPPNPNQYHGTCKPAE